MTSSRVMTPMHAAEPEGTAQGEAQACEEQTRFASAWDPVCSSGVRALCGIPSLLATDARDSSGLRETKAMWHLHASTVGECAGTYLAVPSSTYSGYVLAAPTCSACKRASTQARYR